MLNNITMTDEIKRIVKFEIGEDEDDIAECVVDTRDSFQDFVSAANEVSGLWNDSDMRNARCMLKDGLRYFKGTIQTRAGETRRYFMFIENAAEGFNVVVHG